jgi:hypothetical protein
LEKVGTYIESKTEVKNGIVSSDEIKQYTAGIVKVEQISDERSVLANKASVVKVNVKAVVDSDALIKQVISFRNSKDIEDSAKKMSVDNNKLRKEIEQLNQQLRNVADEKKYQQLNAQRKEIIEQLDTNEKGLVLLLSGEALHTAALLDRQKKDEGKRKVKKFIREIAATYELSTSALEVNDNGDDTAFVTFTVKANNPLSALQPAPFNFKGMTSGQKESYAKKYGVNISDISSTGLKIQFVSNLIAIDCPVLSRRDEQLRLIQYYDVNCSNVLPFMYSELKSVVLFVKLGKYEKKESLFFTDSDRDLYRGLILDFEKRYSTRMSLSELKSLSKLKLTILYDSQEYGQ